MPKKNVLNKYLFLLILLSLLLIVFLIIKPFITSILISFVLAYLFYPVYKKLNNRIKKKNISAFIVALLIILIFSIPFIFVINAFVKEINLGYVSFKKMVTKGDLFNIDCAKQKENILCKLPIKKIFSDQNIRIYIERLGTKVTNYVTETSSRLITSIPKIFLDIFLVLFLTYYLLKDGKVLFFKIISFLPIKKESQKDVIKTFNDVIYATIYGQIIIAVIQGTLGGIGFLIFGVSSPILWGIIMIFLSLIPFIGPSLVWAPAAIYLFVSGLATSSNSLIVRGIGLFAYGLLLVSTIDNILRPVIIGNKMSLHPAMVFLGVIGGILLFGPLGILLGPMLIAILIVFARIYKKNEFLN